MSPAELANATWWAWLWGEIEHWSFLGVVIFLAIEFAALKFGEPYKGKLEKHRELAVADANARAKEAELALHKYKQPRTPNLEEFSEILGKAPPAKVQIAYVRECTDCWWLAAFLGQTLENAHWQVLALSPVEDFKASFVGAGKYPATTALRANPWGVTVITRTPPNSVPFDMPYGALFAALVKSLGGSPAVGGAVDPELAADTIRIVVAPKP